MTTKSRKRTAMMPAELAQRIELLRAGDHSRRSRLAGWFAEYNTPGHYVRTNLNHTAEFAYNHLQSAPSLLWLAEVLGVPRFAVLKAKVAVRGARPNTASEAAAVREVLPWGLVEALLRAKM